MLLSRIGSSSIDILDATFNGNVDRGLGVDIIRENLILSIKDNKVRFWLKDIISS